MIENALSPSSTSSSWPVTVTILGLFQFAAVNTKLVEESRYDLLEALTRRVLDEIMSNPLVIRARVEIEKPYALRYSRTVSVEMSAEKKDGP